MRVEEGGPGDGHADEAGGSTRGATGLGRGPGHVDPVVLRRYRDGVVRRVRERSWKKHVI